MLSHLLAAVPFSQGEIEFARGHIETSLEKRPGNAAAHLLAARIARAAKDFDAALSDLDRAIAKAPQREGYLEKARTLDQASHYQASLRTATREAWQAILEIVPQNIEAAARLGRLAWEDGDHALAASLLERAVAGEVPPRPGSISASSGRICTITRRPRAAYRTALEKKPDHAEAALDLGTVLQETGDLGGAMRAYAAAYRLRPTMFGTIAMALTSAPHGRLWLDENVLRSALSG